MIRERPQGPSLDSADPKRPAVNLDEIDERLRELGQVPSDLERLLEQYTGGTRISAERADVLLAELAQLDQLDQRGAPSELPQVRFFARSEGEPLQPEAAAGAAPLVAAEAAGWRPDELPPWAADELDPTEVSQPVAVESDASVAAVTSADDDGDDAADSEPEIIHEPLDDFDLIIEEDLQALEAEDLRSAQRR
ncbi:MAG: hypothetical protein ABW321_08790 [Polyangiales bacterium]